MKIGKSNGFKARQIPASKSDSILPLSASTRFMAI